MELIVLFNTQKHACYTGNSPILKFRFSPFSKVQLNITHCCKVQLLTNDCI